MIGIYVPTLGRPHALQRVADNIAAATSSPYRIVFVTEPSDPGSHAAAVATGHTALVNADSPSYSNSLQTAYEADDSPYFVAANDDFDFQPGWDTEALRVMGGAVKVVGIDDGGPHCDYSTIALVDRTYIVEQSGVIDMPNRVMFPYQHNYVDTEFFCTACARGVFKAAPRARILHRHPDWGFAELDDTYRKSTASMSTDGAKFNERAPLWS